MKTKRNAALWLIVLFAASANASETLFEQFSISIGNPADTVIGISSTQSDDPDEPRAKTWDNFSLSADATITQIAWEGTYNGAFNSNEDFRGEVDFVIEVFGNLPGDVPDLDTLVYATILDGGTAGRDDGVGLNATVIADALQKDGGLVMQYEADLTFDIAAGDYWLSIVADQTFPSPHPDDAPEDPNAFLDPTWSWILSAGGDDLMYQYDALFDDEEPGFRFTPENCPTEGCDTTFALRGEVVPEPTAAGLLGIAVFGLGLLRRRVRR